MPLPPARRAALRRRLLAWWDAGHRDLPWRFPQHAADPYRVWIAEVMLQQTQVAAVIPYYRRFIARFPTLETLAGASDDEVLALWSGLGYYARGRNLARAAREALASHGGLPASVAALRALPGFGPYTAGAVASIAFAVPAAAVDGNVTRVLARVEALAGDPGGRRVRDRLHALAAALAGERPGSPAPAFSRPGDLNQALMELGATVCTKADPACARCPHASLCVARATDRAAELPWPRARPARRELVLACAITWRRGALLVTRRPAPGLFGGMWAPPSTELAAGEDARAALGRALRDAHGASWDVGGELAACERVLTHRRLVLRAFACEPRGRLAESGGLRWAGPAALDGLGVPSALRALLAAAGGGPERAAPGAGLRQERAARSASPRRGAPPGLDVRPPKPGPNPDARRRPPC